MTFGKAIKKISAVLLIYTSGMCVGISYVPKYQCLLYVAWPLAFIGGMLV